LLGSFHFIETSLARAQNKMPFSSFCVSALAIASQANALSWEQPAGLPRYGSFFGLPGKNATYDYVIVGGGTAGLTVASRLAEDKSLSIAVVEAGTFSEISNGNNSQVPAYSFSSVAGGGEYVNAWIDWELETTPQPVRSWFWIRLVHLILGWRH
jgi:choline dehydrogenase